MKMELNEKESHCIARLLQGAMFSESFVNGCAFCKFKCRTDKDPAPHLDEIRMKLMKSTGVDLGWMGGGILRPNGFPYRRFLKNSNEEIKEKVRQHLLGVLIDTSDTRANPEVKKL